MWQYNKLRLCYNISKARPPLPPPQPGMKARVKQHVYIGRNVQGVHGLVVPPHRLPAMVQQELLKVPPGDSGLWLHDSEHNLQSVSSSPDIVLMEGFIKQVVGFLELFPHGRAPALEECVYGILVLAIHLQIPWSMLEKWTTYCLYSRQSWQTAQSWAQSCPLVWRVSV